MRFSAPKNVTWWIAAAFGVVGLLLQFDVLSFDFISAFWAVAIGFLLLLFATLLKDL